MAKTVKRQKAVVERIIVEEKSPTNSVKNPKRLLPLIFGLLIVTGLIYFGGKVFIAASVNGQLINRLSVVRELEKQGGQKTLDTIILKALINQEARKRKVVVSEKELNAELSKIEKNVTSQGATLDSLLEQQGMTKNDLTNEIKLQLLVTKMVDNNISISDKEVDDYLASQKEQSSIAGLDQANQVTPELTKDQAKAAIKQQKIQAKIQTFVADLKAKAKINYFIKY